MKKIARAIRNHKIISIILLMIVTLYVYDMFSYAIIGDDDHQLHAIIIWLLLLSVAFWAVFRAVVSLCRLQIRSLLFAAVALVLLLKFPYHDEYFEADMYFKGYLYSAIPPLCHASGYKQGEYASICYVYRTYEYYTLIENPSGEMKRPVKEWPIPLLRNLEGPKGVVAFPTPSTWPFVDEGEQCTFDDTRRVAGHIYFTSGSC